MLFFLFKRFFKLAAINYLCTAAYIFISAIRLAPNVLDFQNPLSVALPNIMLGSFLFAMFSTPISLAASMLIVFFDRDDLKNKYENSQKVSENTQN